MVPPAVQAMPREGLIVTRKGQDVTLRCSGRGNPNPRITWSKKVRRHWQNTVLRMSVFLSFFGQNFVLTENKMACPFLSSLECSHLEARPKRASLWNCRAFVGKTPGLTFARLIMGSDRRPARKFKWKSSVSAERNASLPISVQSSSMDQCQTVKLLKGFKASSYT